MAGSERRPAIGNGVARAVLTEAGHRCAVCGESCPIERAHIVPWHRSKRHQVEDLICLCANCHSRADNEKWGEATLRIYKANPWVVRARSDKNTDAWQQSLAPGGIPPEYISYLRTCRSLLEYLDTNERFEKHRPLYPVLCPACFRLGKAVETDSTEKSFWCCGASIDQLCTSEGTLRNECHECGTRVYGNMTVISILHPVPRITLPNLSRRLSAVCQYISRIYDAVKSNSVEALVEVLKLRIWERANDKHRVKDLRLVPYDRGTDLGNEWCSAPINENDIFPEAFWAMCHREHEAKHVPCGLASPVQPSLTAIAPDSILNRVGFYRDAWDEAAARREVTVPDLTLCNKKPRCVEDTISRAGTLLLKNRKEFRLVMSLKMREISSHEVPKEAWRRTL